MEGLVQENKIACHQTPFLASAPDLNVLVELVAIHPAKIFKLIAIQGCIQTYPREDLLVAKQKSD